MRNLSNGVLFDRLNMFIFHFNYNFVAVDAADIREFFWVLMYFRKMLYTGSFFVWFFNNYVFLQFLLDIEMSDVSVSKLGKI